MREGGGDKRKNRYMKIHVHSTLAMKEVGGKERQPRQITPRPDKQDTQTRHTGHRFHQPYRNRTNQFTQMKHATHRSN